MISLLFYPKNSGQLKTCFLLHIGIGLLGLISNFFVIIWFYVVLIQAFAFVNSAGSIDERHLRIIYLLLYIAPFEIISRMLNCSPLIPYELGKYITFILLLWGLSFSKHRNKTGYVLIVLLVPGIILGWPKEPDYRRIIFNTMGLINLGLGMAYFGGLYLNKIKFDINNGVRLITYSLCVTLVYTFFQTPDYEEIDFQLGANFEASGGFGSNQVSTAFGLGMFLCFYLWQQGTSFSGFGWFVDLILSGFFLFQGLLTFSRGGIFGGVLAIVLLILLGRGYSVTGIKNRWKNRNLGKIALFSLPILIVLTLYANTITKGNLLLRYEGETYGTLIGKKEKDLEVITSGRSDIFLGDIDLFFENPIFGTGVGVSRYERKIQNGIVAHVEISRLMAEHGIFGIIIFLILLYGLLSIYIEKKKSVLILVILSFIGFYTTFHAATRTFLSPLLISIAYLPVRSLKLN